MIWVARAVNATRTLRYWYQDGCKFCPQWEAEATRDLRSLRQEARFTVERYLIYRVSRLSYPDESTPLELWVR
jgi:hypothetical protein